MYNPPLGTVIATFLVPHLTTRFKMQLLSIFTLAVALLAPTIAAQVIPPAPPLPSVQYLFSGNISVGLPLDVGQVPAGNVTVIPVIGGAVSGPKIAGMSH